MLMGKEMGLNFRNNREIQESESENLTGSQKSEQNDKMTPLPTDNIQSNYVKSASPDLMKHKAGIYFILL